MASISKQSKETQDRHRKMLVEMLKKPENAECMDCRARNPTWASINLGVFVCIRCSGLHRQVGVHISKVRSCTMDLWEPEQIAFMQTMGNARGKALYEALLPPDYGKPSENEDSQLVLQWIRTKYEKKRYYSPNPVAVMAATLTSSPTTSASAHSPNSSTHVNLDSMTIRPAKAKKPRAEPVGGGGGAPEGGAQSPSSPQPPSSPINEFSYEQFMSPAIQSPRQSDFEAPPLSEPGASSGFSFLHTDATTTTNSGGGSHVTEGSAFSFLNRGDGSEAAPNGTSVSAVAVGNSGGSAFSFLNEPPKTSASVGTTSGANVASSSPPSGASCLTVPSRGSAELPPDSLLSFSKAGGVPLIPGHFATPNVPVPTGGIVFDPFEEHQSVSSALPSSQPPASAALEVAATTSRPTAVPVEVPTTVPADDPQALLAAMQQQMMLLQQLALAAAQQQSA